MSVWEWESDSEKLREWESESGGVNMIERVREWDREIERDSGIVGVIVTECNRVKEKETVRVRISKHNQIYASATQIYDLKDQYVWASIQIIVVMGSNPTWASFLYKLLKSFTRFWIPQGLLAKRVKVKKWKRMRESEWERQSLRVREWEWDSNSEGECESENKSKYIRTQPKLCES